jgi:hypothetical protein
MSDDLGQPKLGPHGGPRTKGQRSAETMRAGVRRSYILARLERDGRHDLAEAIREGRVSAYTVAVELGWTKRPEPLGTGSINAAKRRQHQLRRLPGLPGGGANSLSSDQMMELWLGPGPQGSLFGSPEELQEACEQARDAVLRLFGKPGRRAMAWWAFDASQLGLQWPGYDREQSYLFEMGILSETECTELVRFWRREFARSPRRDHHKWADIPKRLIREWTAERARSELQQ